MGCGSSMPQKIINNDQLGQRVDTNDEWIKSRTGIRERRVIGDNESLNDLATNAALNAIKMANEGKSIEEISQITGMTKEEIEPIMKYHGRT